MKKTVSAALTDFLEAGRANGLRPASLKWYASLLSAFAARHGADRLKDVSSGHIRRYIIDLRERKDRYTTASQRPKQSGGLSDSSIASHMRALFAFWGWCEREYGVENPMRNIKHPKQPQPSPKSILPEDFVKLFNCADSYRDRAMLAFLADTGCRLGGLAGLRIEHINLVDRRARVTEKGEITRNVVFTGYTRVLLLYCFDERKSGAAWPSLTTGEPLKESGIYQMLKKLKKRAGVTGRVNPHSFRHRFAIAYLEAGGDAISLAKLMGDDIQTVYHYYAGFMPDELSILHERFSPLLRMMQTPAETS